MPEILDEKIERLTNRMYEATRHWTVRPPRSKIAQLAIIALLEMGGN